MLMALYSGLQCAVVWNGIVGYRFDVKCGVRQGGLQKMVDICSDYGNRFEIRLKTSIPRRVKQLSSEGVLPLILL